MTQEEFTAQLHAILNEELITISDDALHKLCTKAGSFTMTVPPRIDDTDMIFSELIRRFKILSQNTGKDKDILIDDCEMLIPKAMIEACSQTGERFQDIDTSAVRNAMKKYAQLRTAELEAKVKELETVIAEQRLSIVCSKCGNVNQSNK